MPENKIIFIATDKLCAHPNNPRKNLGELAELADSIEANGVLQNLTVVPYPGEVTGEPIEGLYRVVIGHRRLAAAKLADVDMVPCFVTDMDERTQIAAMLLENIQRSDLTVYEQAEGFQMMLDLGETVETIADKTGFSESTVRRRTKLLDLDRDRFRDSVERGGTLGDFIKLDQIKDPERKDAVLGKVGTYNFEYELKKAVEEEQRETVRTGILAQLGTFAQLIETRGAGMVAVDSWHLWGMNEIPEIEVPEDAEQTEYYYTQASYGLSLYRKRDESEAPAQREETEEEKQRREIKERLTEISKRAYALRYEYIKNFSATKKQAQAIMEFAVHALLCNGYYSQSDFLELMGLESDDEGEVPQDELQAAITVSPERTLLIASYCMFGDRVGDDYHDWQGRYDENEDLDMLYAQLEKLGYEVSDEERAWMDGSSDLYLPPEEE